MDQVAGQTKGLQRKTRYIKKGNKVYAQDYNFDPVEGTEELVGKKYESKQVGSSDKEPIDFTAKAQRIFNELRVPQNMMERIILKPSEKKRRAIAAVRAYSKSLNQCLQNQKAFLISFSRLKPAIEN